MAQHSTRYPGIEAVAGGYRIRFAYQDPRKKKGELSEIDRIRKGVSLREALRLLTLWREEAHAGRAAQVRERLTLTAYTDSWVLRKAAMVRPHTAKQYVVALLRILDARPRPNDPPLRAWLLEAIDHEVAGLVVAALAASYAPRTVRQTVKIARLVWGGAIADGHVTTSPWDVDMPRIPKQQIPNRLTSDQFQSFFQAAQRLYPDDIYPMLIVAFTLGMRQGEARAILWSDLDASQGVVTISRTVVSTWTGDTKTGETPTGQMPAGCSVLDMLAALRRQQIERGVYNPRGLMFPGRGGKHISATKLRLAWIKICEAAGVTPGRGKGVTPHAARRTLHNVGLEAGVSGTIIRTLTGHLDQQMTDKYTTVAVRQTEKLTGAVIRLFPAVGETWGSGRGNDQADEPKGAKS